MGEERGYSLKTLTLAFVSGGLVGAAVALLLAPKSGQETREQFRGYARRAEENMQELADTATQAVAQAMHRGREFIKDNNAVLAEAVEAGRAAMEREYERPAAGKKA